VTPVYGLAVYHEDLMVSAGLGHATFAIDIPGSRLLELPSYYYHLMTFMATVSGFSWACIAPIRRRE
jgi:hypothetical protein